MIKNNNIILQEKKLITIQKAINYLESNNFYCASNLLIFNKYLNLKELSFKRLQLIFYKEKDLKTDSKYYIISKKKYFDKKAIFLLNTDPIINKFLNNLMIRGNKAQAEKILFLVLANIKKILKKSPYYWFKKGLFMLQSYMWLQKIKRFKTNVTPNTISSTHNISRSSKNLIKYARLRVHERSIDEQIANEILETLKKKSVAFKKKGELERLIVLNRINTRWRYK